MHESGCAGGELGDPDDGTLPGADIVVTGNETLALGGIAGLRIVGRHPVGRPDLASGDLRAAQSADSREPLVGLDHGLAACVVPGDDAPYFDSHVYPPLMIVPETGYSPADRPCYSSGTASSVPIDNRSSC